jgi:hypothetical protein
MKGEEEYQDQKEISKSSNTEEKSIPIIKEKNSAEINNIEGGE